jgi:TonB dependent receptor/CarboxypepD_reg-like domain/TonB-dependent Receptor Plug Domain
MKIKILTILIIFCLSIASLQAHNGILRGQILSIADRQPLVGVTVQISALNIATNTDVFGFFEFKDLPTGQYSLVASYLGFENHSQSVEIQENTKSEIKIEMTEGALNLETVTVKSGDERRLNLVNSIDVGLRTVNSSQDILRVVPGLFMAQHAGGGKAEQIFLRGFDIDHGTDINLQVDGMPVNMVSHAHGQGYSDLHFLIPELVNQVSFEKGPYYAQKGDFTTAGFVDFTTFNALDKSMLKVEAGQFGTLRTVIALDVLGKSAKDQGQSTYIAGEYLISEGYFEAPQQFKRLNLFAKYHQWFDQNKSLTISASTFRSSWDASGQIPERAVKSGLIGRFGAIDPTEGGETSRINLNAQFRYLMNNGAVMNQQVYLIRYDFELYSNFTFFLDDPINGDQIRQKEKRTIFGYQGSINNDFTLGNIHLNAEAGLGIRADDIKDNELTHTAGRKTDIERLMYGDVFQNNLHFYLNQILELTPRFNIQAGLRVDYFQFEYIDKLNSAYQRQSENKTFVSPKLQANYDLNDRVRLYARTGIGFHSNDTRVVVAQKAREILPKAVGIDLGLVLKPINNLVIQMAIWQLDLDQEFVYVGDAGIVEPSGKTQRQGIDISLRYQLSKGLFADVDFNMTQAKALGVPNAENKIPLAPTMTSIGGLTYRFKNGLNGSLRYRYLADRPANEDNSLKAEGYFLMDAVLKYTQTRYEFGLSIENIWNTPWKEAQFDTESRLQSEAEPVSEIHFTPGSSFFVKASLSYFF